MAPLPHNSTPIYFLDYTTVATNHTLEVRAAASVSPATFGSIMDAFLTFLSPLLLTLTVNGARFQAAGQTVSNPVTITIAGNTYGSGVASSDSVPYCLNFIGRSTGGRRVRLMVFGYKGLVTTYRLTSAESADIANCVNTLNNTANCFQSIDGLDPIWYPYANVMYNAYWQRAVRA
jgi:hypothetical protein